MARKKNLFNPDEFRMSFGEHLEELRTRLIHALVGIGIASVVTFAFGMTIINWINEPLLRALRTAGLPPELIATKVTAPFGIYVKVCLIAAAVVSLPWVVHQLWKFVAAGLYETEQRVVHILAPFSAVMTLLGVAFMYYILLPVCLTVLIIFAQSYPAPGGQEPGFLDWLTDLAKLQVRVEDEGQTAPTGKTADNGGATPDATTPPVESAPLKVAVRKKDPPQPKEGEFWFNTVDNELKAQLGGKIRRFQPSSRSSLRPMLDQGDYVNFVLYLTVGVVIAFQVPVLMSIIGWSGIIDPALISKARKYCVFGCFVAGAVLTPQDPLSMLVLALHLWGLFEFGLLLMRRTYPKDSTS